MSPSAENKARHKKYKSWRFRGIRTFARWIRSSKKYWKTKTDAKRVHSAVLPSSGLRPGRGGQNSARREAPGGDFPRDRGLRAGIQSVQAGNSVADRAKVQRTAQRSGRKLRKGDPGSGNSGAQGAAGRGRPIRAIPPAVSGRSQIHARRDVSAGGALLRAFLGRARPGDARVRGEAEGLRSRQEAAAGGAERRLQQINRDLSEAAEPVSELSAQRRQLLLARLLSRKAEPDRGGPAGLPSADRAISEVEIHNRSVGANRRVSLRDLQHPADAGQGGGGVRGGSQRHRPPA